VGDDIKVVVNVIDSTGAHAAATIDTATTRLNGYSAAPTVNTIATGIYEIVFSGVTPAPAEGDRLICKVNGDISGVAWTTYGVPVVIVADERGTDSVTSLDAAGVRTAVGLASANLDTQLNNINTQVGTIDGIVDDILVDTGTDIPASIAALNNFDPASDQVIVATNNDKTGYSLSTAPPTAAEIYTEFISGSNEDAFKADVTGISAQISALNDLSTTDVENSVWDAAYASHTSAGTFGKLMDILRKANRGIEGTVSGTPTASAFDTNLTGYTTGALDSETLVFLSGALEGEARPILSYNATNGRITFEEALTAAPTAADEFIILPYHVHPISEIYSYFVDGSNEDAFKADVSALATSSDLATVDSNVDSIKSVTDQMVFTVSGQIDANALTGGGGDDAATIYSYFTASNRQDQFKADVSSVGVVVGSGAISHEITVNVAGSPSDGVEVWVSTDSSGSNVVAGTLVTDAFGKATFMLDAGTYYLWAQKAGNNFANPTSFSVS
jgi:hypothetical protein